MAEDWSDIEVELIVADYFAMLAQELKGEVYNKTAYRKVLSPKLNGRSDGSIEFKHQNISAALVDLGKPYIKGYKPRGNYQEKLIQHLSIYLDRNTLLEPLFLTFSDEAVPVPVIKDFAHLVESPPVRENMAKELKAKYNRRPVKINYLEREQQNSALGKAGEEYVLEYEKWRLQQEGKAHLIDKIEWVSKFDDSAGYDIHSFNADGTERLIEVKTTKLSKETPFFFSKAEYECSKTNTSAYHLYRLFDFNENPRMFIHQGSFDDFCKVEPTMYKGSF